MGRVAATQAATTFRAPSGVRGIPRSSGFVSTGFIICPPFCPVGNGSGAEPVLRWAAGAPVGRVPESYSRQSPVRPDSHLPIRIGNRFDRNPPECSGRRYSGYPSGEPGGVSHPVAVQVIARRVVLFGGGGIGRHPVSPISGAGSAMACFRPDAGRYGGCSFGRLVGYPPVGNRATGAVSVRLTAA